MEAKSNSIFVKRYISPKASYGYLKLGAMEHDMFAVNSAVDLAMGGFFICLDGVVELMIDMRRFVLNPGDLCVCFPGSQLEVKSRTDNCRGTIIAMDTDLIMDINLPSSTTPYYLHIKENPCIPLTESEHQKLIRLCDMVIEIDQNGEHLFGDDISKRLLMIICFEIANIYATRKPISQIVNSQKDVIFQRFLSSLTKNFMSTRSLDYYASEASVTPRYFSKIIKEISGLSYSQWIEKTVMHQAQRMLKTTTMTIQEISLELNFANPSFFSQYFKKRMSVTPKAYRKHSGEYDDTTWNTPEM